MRQRPLTGKHRSDRRRWVFCGYGALALLILPTSSVVPAGRVPDRPETSRTIADLDAGYFACVVADSIRVPDFPTDWPRPLQEVAALMEELGDSLFVSARGRLIWATFSPGDQQPEWFDSVVARVSAVPGVLSVACLPPLDPDPAHRFFHGARGGIEPPQAVEACRIPRGPCPGSDIVIDVVFDSEGRLLEPIVLDVDEECRQHVLAWLRDCRWTPAHRENGNVPFAGQIGIPLE